MIPLPDSLALHRGRPTFFSVAYDWKGAEEWSLYVDLARDGRIQALNYQGPHRSIWPVWFELLSRAAEGLMPDEARRLSTADLLLHLQDLADGAEDWHAVLDALEEEVPWGLPLVNVPLYLMSEALRDYQGRVRSHSEYHRRPSETLICRCFGLYSGQIEEMLLKDPSLDLLKVGEETRAGAGCASCLDDIEEAIDDARDRLGVDPTVVDANYLVAGLYQAQLVLKIDEALSQMPLARGLFITSLEGHQLELMGNIETSDSLAQIIENEIREKIGARIRVKVTPAS